MSSVMNRILAVSCRRAFASRSFLAATGTASTVTSRNMADLAFTFASPQEIFYKQSKIRQVDVPTLAGDFGILPEHVPTIAALRPGVVVVTENNGNAKKFFVSSGTVSVNADSSVQMLAEEAFTLDSFDPAATKESLAKAQRELASATTEKQKAEAQIAVECLEALNKALGGV